MTMQQKTNPILIWLKKNARFLSISAIEKEIGCPATTIQKFVDGKRTLPLKWQKPLFDFLELFKK